MRRLLAGAGGAVLLREVGVNLLLEGAEALVDGAARLMQAGEAPLSRRMAGMSRFVCGS